MIFTLNSINKRNYFLRYLFLHTEIISAYQYMKQGLREKTASVFVMLPFYDSASAYIYSRRLIWKTSPGSQIHRLNVYGLHINATPSGF